MEANGWPCLPTLTPLPSTALLQSQSPNFEKGGEGEDANEGYNAPSGQGGDDGPGELVLQVAVKLSGTAEGYGKR